MKALGQIPTHLSAAHVLNSIGENVIIANTDYTIQWMNKQAAALLNQVAPLYGIKDAAGLIGLSMDHFHGSPNRQRSVVDSLTGSHRARINIKDLVVTDIVVTPMKTKDGEVNGYIVLLTDVTTKAEEEAEKEKLIRALSVPIIHIWDRVISLPLIGEFDTERADRMIVSVLEECARKRIECVLLDVSGLFTGAGSTVHHHIQKLTDCLRLIGAECIVTGITSELARSMEPMDRQIQTFQTAYAGLQYIISRK